MLADGDIASVRAVGNSAAARRGRALPPAACQTRSRRSSGRRRPAAPTRAGRTHGRVTESNAHPHFDTTDRVHVVVNGIVENYLALNTRRADSGAQFTSETDAEVIAHLISHHMALGSLVEAVRAAHDEHLADALEGHGRRDRARAVSRVHGRRAPSSPSRVMVEAPTDEGTDAVCARLVALVEAVAAA